MRPIPKPEPRKRTKARKSRLEAKVIKAVRAAVEERDGYCRLSLRCLAWRYGPCEGESEWCHLGQWKRSKTRNMPPEERHSTRGSFMACTKHHQLYDAHEIDIEYGPNGADGTLVVRRAA